MLKSKNIYQLVLLSALFFNIGKSSQEKFLVLSGKGLTSKDLTTLDFTNVEEIDLSNNDLTEIKSNLFEHALKVNLSGNEHLNLPEINPFLESETIQELYLANCGIENLPENVFMGLPELNLIDLSENDFPLGDLFNVLTNMNNADVTFFLSEIKDEEALKGICTEFDINYKIKIGDSITSKTCKEVREKSHVEDNKKIDTNNSKDDDNQSKNVEIFAGMKGIKSQNQQIEERPLDVESLSQRHENREELDSRMRNTHMENVDIGNGDENLQASNLVDSEEESKNISAASLDDGKSEGKVDESQGTKGGNTDESVETKTGLTVEEETSASNNPLDEGIVKSTEAGVIPLVNGATNDDKTNNEENISEVPANEETTSTSKETINVKGATDQEETTNEDETPEGKITTIEKASSDEENDTSTDEIIMPILSGESNEETGPKIEETPSTDVDGLIGHTDGNAPIDISPVDENQTENKSEDIPKKGRTSHNELNSQEEIHEKPVEDVTGDSVTMIEDNKEIDAATSTDTSKTSSASTIMYIAIGIGVIVIAMFGYSLYKKRQTSYNTVNREENQGRELQEIRTVRHNDNNSSSSAIPKSKIPEIKPLMYSEPVEEDINKPGENEPKMYGELTPKTFDEKNKGTIRFPLNQEALDYLGSSIKLIDEEEARKSMYDNTEPALGNDRDGLTSVTVETPKESTMESRKE